MYVHKEPYHRVKSLLFPPREFLECAHERVEDKEGLIFCICIHTKQAIRGSNRIDKVSGHEGEWDLPPSAEFRIESIGALIGGFNAEGEKPRLRGVQVGAEGEDGGGEGGLVPKLGDEGGTDEQGQRQASPDAIEDVLRKIWEEEVGLGGRRGRVGGDKASKALWKKLKALASHAH